MKAYRVWVTWVDGIEGFAGWPFEKRDRADTICAELTAKPSDYFIRVRPNKPIKKFDVREEDVPSTLTVKGCGSVYSNIAVLGDDQNATTVGR